MRRTESWDVVVSVSRRTVVHLDVESLGFSWHAPVYGGSVTHLLRSFCRCREHQGGRTR